MFFFFKQKTAYEMRISDWSSDVCSSDLARADPRRAGQGRARDTRRLDRARDRRRGRAPARRLNRRRKIGRASCRERVCQYVSISVVAVSLKKKITTKTNNNDTTKYT